MYLNSHMFTELHLDGIFKYGDDNTLPIEVRCSCLSSAKHHEMFSSLD